MILLYPVIGFPMLPVLILTLLKIQGWISIGWTLVFLPLHFTAVGIPLYALGSATISKTKYQSDDEAHQQLQLLSIFFMIIFASCASFQMEGSLEWNWLVVFSPSWIGLLLGMIAEDGEDSNDAWPLFKPIFTYQWLPDPEASSGSVIRGVFSRNLLLLLLCLFVLLPLKLEGIITWPLTVILAPLWLIGIFLVLIAGTCIQVSGPSLPSWDPYRYLKYLFFIPTFIVCLWYFLFIARVSGLIGISYWFFFPVLFLIVMIADIIGVHTLTYYIYSKPYRLERRATYFNHNKPKRE